MSNSPRFVVLQFDDGGRFDYEPPLPHPADMFLERFSAEERFSRDVGAVMSFEVADPDQLNNMAYVKLIYPPSPPSFP